MEKEEKWDRRFLETAEFFSRWSKDPSTKVGAVIVDADNRIRSVGYNGFPRGVYDLPKRLENRELKYKITVHAERNAIIFAHESLEGCRLYTWPFMPCATCAAMVIQSKIIKVVAPPSDNPRWVEEFKLATTMFQEAQVELKLMGAL